MHGIERWVLADRFDDDSASFLPWHPTPSNFEYNDTTHAPIRQAFEMQSEIGWDELLRGRLCLQWSELVERHNRQRRTPRSVSRQAWETSVIHAILQLFLRTWQQRNDLIHGATDAEQAEILNRSIDDKIRHEYSHQQTILPQHQPLFSQFTLQTRLQFPLHLKQQWLRSVHAARTAWASVHSETD